MLNDEIFIGSPEEGSIEREYVSSNTYFMRWARGDGYVHHLIIVKLASLVGGYIGGDYMISLEVKSGTLVSRAMNPRNLKHMSYLEEKLGDYFKGVDLYYVAALLNWVFGDDETKREYARECYQKAAVGN